MVSGGQKGWPRNTAWNPTHVRDTQWKVVYSNKQALAFEQDHAAGGRDNCIMHGSGALAWAVLQPRNGRLYTEMRWEITKKQQSRYLGEVTATNRAANLAAGWQLAHDLGLTTASNAADRGRVIVQE